MNKVLTLGPLVSAWTERYLVHGSGDYLGKPIRWRPWQRALFNAAYRLHPDGSRAVSRALWGLPKGNAKTETAAAISVAELAGPVVCTGFDAQGRPQGTRRSSPVIPIAAASYKQADLVYGAARAMIAEGPLRDHFTCYDKQIVAKDAPGLLERVAAEAGTNDGGRPSFTARDEVHEWTGRKERVHLVLSNNLAKRRQTWSLDISTAGWDTESLLGRLYAHGQRVAAGEMDDPSLSFVWYQAAAHWDLSVPEQLDAAIREANPAAGDFLPLESIRQRYYEMPEFEFRRYHLNQWTAAPDRWFPVGVFEAQGRAVEVPDGTRIALGFDGSWSGDSTALLGCTLEGTPHVFVVDAWERPPQSHDEWRVDVLAVMQTIRNACARWKVVGVASDPYRWQMAISQLRDEGLPMVEFPQNANLLVPAFQQFDEAIRSGLLTHDADPRLIRDVAHAVVKVDARGPRIVKERPDSPRRIDCAVAALFAYDVVVRQSKRVSVYESRGVRTV